MPPIGTEEVQSKTKNTKEYSYILNIPGETTPANLSFSLCIDDPKYLVSFKAILQAAIAEVDEDLAKIGQPISPQA